MLHELEVELERVAAAGVPVAAAYVRSQIRSRARHRQLEHAVRKLRTEVAELRERVNRWSHLP